MAATKKAVDDGEVIENIRLIQPGAHVEGSLTELIRSNGKGRHCGWTLVEDAIGVTATKEGQKRLRFPWSRIKQLEYAE